MLHRRNHLGRHRVRRTRSGLEVDELHPEVLRGERVSNCLFDVLAGDRSRMAHFPDANARLDDEITNRDRLEAPCLDMTRPIPLFTYDPAACMIDVYTPDNNR